MAVADGFFDGDEEFISQEEEARRDDEGALLGDPRRCPRHPHVVTSSPNGMVDGLCWECEAAADGAPDDEVPAPAPAAPLVRPAGGWPDDDIPF